MRAARRHRTDQGFTLVEVVVASALLLVVLLASARVFAAAGSANAGARAATHATALAVEKMEQLRQVAIDDPALALSPSGTLAASVDGFSDAPTPQFVRRWAVEPLPSYPDGGIVVHVLVLSRSGAGRAYVSTIRARKPAAAIPVGGRP